MPPNDRAAGLITAELRSEGNDTCIRPVLEIPAELTEKDFKVVTLDLNGGYVWSTAGRTSGKIKSS